MTRKLSVLLVLAFFVMSLGSLALAANAKPATQSSSTAREASALKTMTLPDNDGSGAATSGKPTNARPTSLGYYMVGEVQVGSTELDWQSNDRQQRQVVMGSDNKIHAVWTNRDFGMDPVGPRSVNYSGYTAGSGIAPTLPWNISPIPGNGGYGSIAVGPGDSLAIATYHYTKNGTGYDSRPRAAIGRQLGSLSNAFLMFDYPSSDTIMPNILNCQGIKTSGVPLDTVEGGYIWPSIAADFDPVSTKTIAHVLAKESPVQDTTGKASLVYWKTLPDALFPGAYTCGTLLDSTSSNVSYDIAASPVSLKVAAVYLYPKTWTGYDVGDNDDIVYRESGNLGTDWGAKTTIRAFDSKDSIGYMYERPEEVSALYDANDNLHVLYKTYWAGISPDDSLHYYRYLATRIWHWSSNNPTCQVMLLDGRAKNEEDEAAWWQSTGRPPLGQHLVGKISLTQCTVASGPDAGTRLYAVYTLYPDSSGMPGNTHSDRSAKPILNGDVVVQASTDLTGSLWGLVVNVTDTRSDGCAAGSCFSEGYTNAAPYTNDSMRIQYLLDKDAGSALQGTAPPASSQGIFTDNPVIIKSWPCFAPASVAILAVSPTSVQYPSIHTTPGAGPIHAVSVPVTLTNTGNTDAVYTRTVAPASSWLSFANASPTGSVPAGCIQTLAETITATGPASEGLYKATVTWTYNPGGKIVTTTVECWNFTNWFMEENNTIRTAQVQMGVSQSSRVGRMRQGAGFRFFADPTSDNYFYDGSLFIGKDNLSLSLGLFADTGSGGGVSGHGDTLVGRLLGLSATTFDETPANPNGSGYRHASGVGCNKDSTIAFDVDYYAPKFNDDSSYFMIGKFSLYAGPKAPGATINNVMVAYSADMDIPDDSAFNAGFADPVQQMVGQKGKWPESATRFGAMSGWRGDGLPLVGGTNVLNKLSIHRMDGYVHDSAWTWVQGINSFTPTDSIGDLHSILVFSKTATIKPKASGVFTIYVIYAGQPKTDGSASRLTSVICKGRAFIKNYLYPGLVLDPVVCPSCSDCGDANSDVVIDIADAVFLINYMFKSGTPPADCDHEFGKGDANGDLVVDIADAVFLINYMFKSGKTPCCNGPCP